MSFQPLKGLSPIGGRCDEEWEWEAPPSPCPQPQPPNKAQDIAAVLSAVAPFFVALLQFGPPIWNWLTEKEEAPEPEPKGEAVLEIEEEKPAPARRKRK